MPSSPAFRDPQIVMAHGAGGEASRNLIEGLIQPLLSNPLLDALTDAAVIDIPAGRLAFTTDSFVVQPLVFPGGSIGELAVNGTVNDLAMLGARPLALSAALIIEAGLPTEVLTREIKALAGAAQRAVVAIATGDTKVVEHGKGDGLYITTTGLGQIDPRANLAANRIQPGDQVLLSGPIANHGMAVMLARAELHIQADIRSDTRPLTPFVQNLLEAVGANLKWLRDATRGGVATILQELAQAAQMQITLHDERLPVDDAVRGACELLGLDPLHVANEGQFIAVVAPDAATAALTALRQTPGGEQACVIGEITAGPHVRVISRNAFGGARVIDRLIGDPLPRIC